LNALRHNWYWKVLSLVIAVVVAVYVRKQQDLVRMPVRLPLDITAPNGQRVVEPAAGEQIQVTLEGPAETVRAIESDEISVIFDTSHVAPGQRVRVPVAVELPPKYRNRVVAEWRPRIVTVRFEADTVREFPVEVALLNRREGWLIPEPLTVTPGRITISGAQDAVDRVARVVAPVSLDDNARINALATLQALDRGGEVVGEQLQLEPPQVTVSGVQQQEAMEKRVPVQPLFQAPPGMRVTEVEVSPAWARVRGTERTVSDVYVVETDPIQLPEGRTQISQEVRLVSPKPGVEVVPGQVRLRLTLEAQARPTPPPPQPQPPAVPPDPEPARGDG
jgi:YbbR domain-containing protein